jgi:hypothetical protein
MVFISHPQEEPLRQVSLLKQSFARHRHRSTLGTKQALNAYCLNFNDETLVNLSSLLDRYYFHSCLRTIYHGLQADLNHKSAGAWHENTFNSTP